MGAARVDRLLSDQGLKRRQDQPFHFQDVETMAFRHPIPGALFVKILFDQTQHDAYFGRL